jgi:hypothetical protein
MRGADVAEPRAHAHRAGRRGAAGDGVEVDALAERVGVVHAEDLVLAVGHVAVLTLDAAPHVRAFEPFAVRVEQRLALGAVVATALDEPHVPRRQLMTRQAEI